MFLDKISNTLYIYISGYTLHLGLTNYQLRVKTYSSIHTYIFLI